MQITAYLYLFVLLDVFMQIFFFMSVTTDKNISLKAGSCQILTLIINGL